MLPKRYKLPLGSSRLLKPKTLRYPHYVMKIGESPLPYSRFGVVIGSRVYPRAVDRNRIKRAFFNFIYRENLHLIPSHDIVVVVSRAVDNLGSGGDFSFVLADLKKSL